MNNNRQNKNIWVIGIIGILLVLGIILWATTADNKEIEAPLAEDELSSMMPENNNDSMENEMEETNRLEDEDTTAMPLTSVTEILNLQDSTSREDIEDRDVELTNATVQAVPSDKVFFVGTAQQSIPVLLDEDLSPESETEGQVNILVGQQVSFNGIIKSVPDATEILNLLGITQGDANALLGNDMYIFVQGTDVSITAQPTN